MQRFEDAVVQRAGEWVGADEIQTALQSVGPRTKVPLEQLGPIDRAMMADQFVRNLRSLSMQQALELQRALLETLDASPGHFHSKLDGAVSLVQLRTHLKHALAAIGLDWDQLTRAQSLVAGVARWLQGQGGATMQVKSSGESIDFVLSAEDLPLTPDEVRGSPLVHMLSTQTARFAVNKDQKTVEITFSIQRAA